MIVMIQSVRISGYRSPRDLRLRLGRVTLLNGANGVGKTNIYRALRMVSSMARGGFAEAVAGEGGMRSLLWTGNEEHPRLTTFLAEVESEAFSYVFKFGLMRPLPVIPPRSSSTPTSRVKSCVTASEHSQIIIVSHSQALCEAVSARCQVKARALTMRLGETRLVGQEHARTVFVCDDEEEEVE